MNSSTQLSARLDSFKHLLGTRHSYARSHIVLLLLFGLVVLKSLEIFAILELFDSRQFTWFMIGTLASTNALGIVILILCAKVLITRESAIAKAVAEHINDGLLFVEGKSVVFANNLARRLLESSDDKGRVELTGEISQIITQAQSSYAPVHYTKLLDGRKRHFLVSKIRLARGPSGIDQRIYAFQDVTFLRENEEAKVNFIGTLSHEIKTPITSLVMALAMLERTGPDAELFRIANSDIARLRTLLDDLLNISKLKVIRDPSVLQKRETNITALLQQTLKSARILADEKTIPLVFEYASKGKIFANIDPTKISWVLTTLLTDAIRQTSPNAKVRVLFEVKENQAEFTIFYERRIDSLGPTGHALVRDIIESHAGNFSAIDLAGGESFFKFSIHIFTNESGIK